MVTITTHPATPARWDDVQRSLTGGGDGRSCQCAWWTHRAMQFDAMTAQEREDAFHAEVDTGPPPGLIAYVDGEAAGWVRVGPRTAQQRIARTRNIVTTTPEPLDDESVWAVTCFVVRKEHRGVGLSSALLDAAVDFAAANGARVVEAYPVDTQGEPRSSNDLYHGALSTFLAAGFHRTAWRTPNRPIVSRELITA